MPDRETRTTEPEGIAADVAAWVEGWVLPYLGEPALWPVLIALLGHVVVVLTPLMLAVWRVQSPAAALALAGALALTFWLSRVGWRIEQYPWLLAATALATWLSSFAFAVLCERTGIL